MVGFFLFFFLCCCRCVWGEGVVGVHVEMVRCATEGSVLSSKKKEGNESLAGSREGATGDGNSR
jgi:hypothetical protein